jgi:hypothetical protein
VRLVDKLRSLVTARVEVTDSRKSTAVSEDTDKEIDAIGIAREANQISRDANAISDRARRSSIRGNIIAAVAVLFSLFSALSTAWQAQEARHANSLSERQPAEAVAQRVSIEDAFIYFEQESLKNAGSSVGVLVNRNSTPIVDVGILFGRPAGRSIAADDTVEGHIDQIPACSALLLPESEEIADKIIAGIQFQTFDGRLWYKGIQGGLSPLKQDSPILAGVNPPIQYFSGDAQRATVSPCNS